MSSHSCPALLCYPIFHAYPRIQFPFLWGPAPASAWLAVIAFAASSRSFLNRIKALILSTNAAKMLCTYDPLFFFCLARWLQKLLSCYRIPLSSDSSPPVCQTLFYCYFWFWSWLLSYNFALKFLFNCVDSGLQAIICIWYKMLFIAEVKYICLSGTFCWASSCWLLRTTPGDCFVDFFSSKLGFFRSDQI